MAESHPIATILLLAVKSIVTNAEIVEIHVSEQEDCWMHTVVVSPRDLGQIIGRGGRVARSLRQVFRAVGAKYGVIVKIDLVSTDGTRANEGDLVVSDL